MFNQETRIHASVGEQLIRKFEDDLTEGDVMVEQLFKVYLLLVIIGQDIVSKLVSIKQLFLQKLMIFQVKFLKSLLWITMIFLVESLIRPIWLVSQFLCHLSCINNLYTI